MILKHSKHKALGTMLLVLVSFSISKLCFSYDALDSALSLNCTSVSLDSEKSILTCALSGGANLWVKGGPFTGELENYSVKVAGKDCSINCKKISHELNF